jgi:hypothetical protein
MNIGGVWFDFGPPNIFVGEVISLMNICSLYLSVTLRHQRIYGSQD